MVSCLDSINRIHQCMVIWWFLPCLTSIHLFTSIGITHDWFPTNTTKPHILLMICYGLCMVHYLYIKIDSTSDTHPSYLSLYIVAYIHYVLSMVMIDTSHGSTMYSYDGHTLPYLYGSAMYVWKLYLYFHGYGQIHWGGLDTLLM